MTEYQILLCEDFSKELGERTVCELGSSSSDFSGKATNPMFYTKIDGTHELSFSLPSHYFDENTGEIKANELVNFITNKSKIRLIKNPGEKQKIFHLVVNNKTDRDNNGILSYDYVCTDSFIEELSKSGYSLSFGEKVGQDGLGTIHELARKILDGTDWEYIEENTGTLYEYSTESKYNIKQQRYDTVYVPQTTHPIQFIPELNRYCNKLDVQFEDNIDTRNVYCYETTEQVVSDSVRNLIYNNSNFTELTGWTNYRIEDNKIEPGISVIPYLTASGTQYLMKITRSGAKRQTFLLNSSAADANNKIIANQPYLFRFDYIIRGDAGGYLRSINIYDSNPLTNPNTLTPVYSQNLARDGGFLNEKYYVIKTRQDISTPYIEFDIVLNKENDQDSSIGRLFAKKFTLFEVKGKATEENLEEGKKKTISAEENNLYLISQLKNGDIVESEELLSKMYLPMELQPEADKTALSAYTHSYVKYFVRDNYKLEEDDNGVMQEVQDDKDREDTLTYLDFLAIKPSDKEIISVSSLPDRREKIDLSKIYKLETDGKYYQYYEITVDGVTNGAWDLALYGTGRNDKRRTLVAEKSNRFNLLQELSELFKVWCVFNIKENDDGTFSKQIWFKEKAINRNFSGFHKGINLQGIERKSDSNEVVTKMFVEDIENQYTLDGFVTIRRAKTNPWGEKFYYNFKYYVDQHLCALNEHNIPYIEEAKENLYLEVGRRNNEIFSLNEKIAPSARKLEELSANMKALTLCISALTTVITSLETDFNDKKVSPPDKKEIGETIKQRIQEKIKNEEQLAQIQSTYNSLKNDYEEWTTRVNTLQQEKEDLIDSFEREYSQYIKEGIWQDASYSDSESYYLDSQKVSETSAMPATSWSITALDGRVSKELEDYTFEVGDLTILVDNEFFGIEKSIEENYTFEVLISGIKEYFEDSSKNEIEVRNYLTSFEDIFQRISAATQTLELKEQTYDKAANFTANGKVDKNIFQQTLSDNSFILANSSDNSYQLDNSGLSLQSQINPAKKMRIMAEGLFISNSINILTGEPEWKTGITADGINASVLTAGEINTANIRIFSGGQPNQTWNALGITSYQIQKVIENGEEVIKVDTNRFIRFDNFGFYFVDETEDSKNEWNFDDEGAAWFETKSRDLAIKQIYDNAMLSITEKGFRLNINYEGQVYIGDLFGQELSMGYNVGEMKVGFLEKQSDETFGIETDLYGFYMKSAITVIVDDKEETYDTSVIFKNNGEHQINEWKISQNTISVEGNWLLGGETVVGKLFLSPASVKGELSTDTIERSFDLSNGFTMRFGNWNLRFDEENGLQLGHYSQLINGGLSSLFRTYHSSDKSHGIKVYRVLTVSDTDDNTGWSHTLSAKSGLTLKHKGVPFLSTPYSEKGTEYLKIDATVRITEELRTSSRITSDAGITVKGGGTTTVTEDNKEVTKVVPMIVLEDTSEVGHFLFVNSKGRFQVDDGFDIYGGLTCSSLRSNNYVKCASLESSGTITADGRIYANSGLTIKGGGTDNDNNQIVPILWFRTELGTTWPLWVKTIATDDVAGTETVALYFENTRIA